MSGSRTNVLPGEYAALNAAAAAIREASGTGNSRMVLDLLELLEAQYLQGLRTVAADRLAGEQGKLSQVTALIHLFQGRPHSTGAT